MRLNPTQERHFYFSLVHLDGQLGTLAALLRPTEDTAVFARHVADVEPGAAARVSGAIESIRAGIRGLMARHGIVAETPVLGAQQAAQALLAQAEIAIEELGPDAMRGFGPLNAQQAEQLTLDSTALRELIAAALATLLDTVQATVLATVQADTTSAASPTPPRQRELGAQLATQAGAALAVLADALAEALTLRSGIPSDELPLIASDALSAFLQARCRAVLHPEGTAAALPPPEVEQIRWRLDRPRLARLGRNYLAARFREQLEPTRVQIEEAMRRYGVRVERASTRQL